MPEQIDDVHRDIARIVLAAIAEHQAGGRFGLTGGNALSVHGLLNRLTEDVDVALGALDHFGESAAAARAALADHGYTVYEVDESLGWEDDEEAGMAAMVAVTANGDREIQVELGLFDLYADPVNVANLGPVLALDDVAGNKAAALANRMLTRDFCDIAALRTRYGTARLIELAMERDAGLTLADFTEAVLHLDVLKDAQLEEVLSGTRLTAAWVREQFADWPRDATRGS